MKFEFSDNDDFLITKKNAQCATNAADAPEFRAIL